MDEFIKIDLKSEASSVIKAGLTVRAFIILAGVLGSIITGIRFLHESVTAFIVLLVIGLILFRIFFKMLDSAFFKEYIIVTKHDLTITHKTVSSTKRYQFNLADIAYLGFSDQKYTRHQMDNPVVDFTGLGVGERELQYVIDEGNIKLETKDRAIKFGRNMPSWDVEDVIEQIEHYSGRSFGRYKPEDKEESEEEIPEM